MKAYIAYASISSHAQKMSSCIYTVWKLFINLDCYKKLIEKIFPSLVQEQRKKLTSELENYLNKF